MAYMMCSSLRVAAVRRESRNKSLGNGTVCDSTLATTERERIVLQHSEVIHYLLKEFGNTNLNCFNCSLLNQYDEFLS